MGDIPALGTFVSDKDAKKPAVGETVVGLPEVRTSGAETQVGLDPVTNPMISPETTAPSLAPVPTQGAQGPTPEEGPTNIGAPPARRPSRVAVAAQPDPAAPPRRQSKAEMPAGQAPAPQPGTGRRPSRVAVPVQQPPPTEAPTNPRQAFPEAPTNPRHPFPEPPTNPRLQAGAPQFDEAPTDPRQPRAAHHGPEAAGVELSPGLVASVAGALAALGVAAWVFWPSDAPPPRGPTPAIPLAPPPAEPRPPGPAVPDPVVEARPPAPTDPAKPTLALDARTHVIDPFGMHAPDLPLDAAHKYRLRIERDDSKLGTVLARLDEAGGWGVLRKMASHAALQFGGAKALRLHCEPGRTFGDADTFPLELVDLATRKAIEFQVFPAKHCWDLEVMRSLELGEGVRHRVRVPTDAQLKLGENVQLKVAWVLESATEPRTWRAGLLAPGESLLAEGRRARFALLDPYAGDNEGRLDLELLPPDTESSGLVTPSSASGAKFVPVGPGGPK